MQVLKADTAVNILLGPFVDITDGVTPVTDVTLAGADTAGLRKAGGTSFTDLSGDGRTFTHIASGWYYLSLGTGDVDTEGCLEVVISDTDKCLPCIARFMVVNANVYDSLYAAAATDYLQVDTLQLGGGTQSATDLKDLADTGYDPTAHKIQGVVLTDTCTTNSDMRGTDSAALAASWTADLATALGNYTAARAGYLDELASGNLPTDVAGVKTVVDAIQAVTDLIPDGGALTALIADIAAILVDTGTTIPGTLTTIAAYVDELESRLTAARAGYLDELAAANIPADIDTLLGRLTATRAGYLDNLSAGAVALEASITAIKGAGWTDENLTTIDSLVDAIKAITDVIPDAGALTTLVGYVDDLESRITAARAGYLDEFAAANIPADVDTLLSRLSAVRAGYLDNLSAGAVALEATLTAIKGAGWTDENLTTMDAILDAIKAVTDLIPDAGALTALIGYVDDLESRLTAARAGYLDELAAANIPADIDTLLSRISATRAGYLDNLSAGAVALEATLTAIKGAGWTDENLTTIDGLIDAIKAVTDLIPDGGALTTLLANITAILTDTGTTLDGKINSVVTAVTGAFSELPQAKPTATPTLETAIMLIYMALRNQLTTTATELAIYNDAGVKIAKKALSDDGTTFTEAEAESGA